MQIFTPKCPEICQSGAICKNSLILLCNWSSLDARLEISVSMDISVLSFYGYIGTLKFIEIVSKSVKMTLII